jgi:hypothetical protein
MLPADPVVIGLDDGVFSRPEHGCDLRALGQAMEIVVMARVPADGSAVFLERLWRQSRQPRADAGSLPCKAHQFEAVLEQEEEVEIEILPNGEVRARGQTSAQELGNWGAGSP